MEQKLKLSFTYMLYRIILAGTFKTASFHELQWLSICKYSTVFKLFLEVLSEILFNITFFSLSSLKKRKVRQKHKHVAKHK